MERPIERTHRKLCFPCVGTWDNFHVSSKLKGYYSFKKKYTANNLGLVSITHGFYMLLLEFPAAPMMHIC